MPTPRVPYQPTLLSVDWSENTKWESCTFAAACGDEVPEGECHPFCLECVLYAGAQPCCVDTRPLCRYGRMMSPAGIAARLQQYAELSQRYSSGLPRVHRTSLQLARASQPEPRVQAPNPLLKPTAVPQEVIARVCTDVVTNKTAFGEPTTKNHQEKNHLDSSTMNK